jgi:hypothetical protein
MWAEVKLGWQTMVVVVTRGGVKRGKYRRDKTETNIYIDSYYLYGTLLTVS